MLLADSSSELQLFASFGMFVFRFSDSIDMNYIVPVFKKKTPLRGYRLYSIVVIEWAILWITKVSRDESRCFCINGKD